ERADVAIGALGGAGDLLGSNLEEEALPALLEAPLAQIELVRLGEHADAHPPFGIDGEGVDASAALVDVVPGRADRAGALARQLGPFVPADRISDVELDHLRGAETDAERAVRA